MCLEGIDCLLFPKGILQPPLYVFQQLLQIVGVKQPRRYGPMPLHKNCYQLVQGKTPFQLDDVARWQIWPNSYLKIFRAGKETARGPLLQTIDQNILENRTEQKSAVCKYSSGKLSKPSQDTRVSEENIHRAVSSFSFCPDTMIHVSISKPPTV
jgi:hypothetical protein